MRQVTSRGEWNPWSIQRWTLAAVLAAALWIAHFEPASADSVSGKATLNNAPLANEQLEFRKTSVTRVPAARGGEAETAAITVITNANGDYSVFLAPGTFYAVIPSRPNVRAVELVSSPSPVTKNLPFTDSPDGNRPVR